MKNAYLKILVATITTQSALAFSLQAPAENSFGKLAKQFSSPVHETITRKAGASTYLQGIIWNDLPYFVMPKEFGNRCKGIRIDPEINVACIGGFLAHASTVSKHKKIDQSYVLPYRSHYGDMQFLHAMAAVQNESANQTMKKMEDWAEFSYRVAIGEIKPNTKLSRVTSPVTRNYFNQKTGWDVRYLYTAKEPHTKTPDRLVQVIAFGSILHMVQDSFSSAHTCRVTSHSQTCQLDNHGEMIHAFYNYTLQDSHTHSERDLITDFESMSPDTLENPVGATKALTQLYESGADVNTFMAKFKEIMMLTATPQTASAGQGLARPLQSEPHDKH